MATLKVRAANGNFLRSTMGFRSELVEEYEDHDLFSVTNGDFIRPKPCIQRDFEDITAKT